MQAANRRDEKPGPRETQRVKISCCWLYAINKYGFPPSVQDTYKALEDMAALGFDAVELEGVGEANTVAVYEARGELRRRCDTLDLRVINFCPVVPDLFSSDSGRRMRAFDL